MNRRDFLSFAPIGIFAKTWPKLQTDFENFKEFVFKLDRNLTNYEIQKLYDQEVNLYKLLWKVVDKKKSVQVFYMVNEQVEDLLLPLSVGEFKGLVFRLLANTNPNGFILTIFKDGVDVGTIQFIKL